MARSDRTTPPPAGRRHYFDARVTRLASCYVTVSPNAEWSQGPPSPRSVGLFPNPSPVPHLERVFVRGCHLRSPFSSRPLGKRSFASRRNLPPMTRFIGRLNVRVRPNGSPRLASPSREYES